MIRCKQYRVFAQNSVGIGAKTEAIIATPSKPINVVGAVNTEAVQVKSILTGMSR